MHKAHLAKTGRVWRNRKTGEITNDRKLYLKDDESLANWMQVDKPKTAEIAQDEYSED